jgi:hypothetical protein
MNPPLRVMVTSQPGRVSRELVRGHLYLTLAQEHDGLLEEIDREDAGLDGIEEEDLFPLALSLLRQSTARADLREVDAWPGLHLFIARDGQAASRMVLIPELVSPNALGGVIVAVPAADQLLCVPVRDASALESLQVLASALSRAVDTTDAPLSDQLFWFDGSAWVTMQVEYGETEITVLPPPAFVGTMNRLASMDLVREAAEA